MNIIKGNSKMAVTPFGGHFATRLNGVNSKLVCALSRAEIPNGGCYHHTAQDDQIPYPCPPVEDPVAAPGFGDLH